MGTRRAAVSSVAAALVVAIVIIIAIFAYAALSSRPSASSAPTSSTSSSSTGRTSQTTPTSFTTLPASVVNANGLEFSMSLNTSSLARGSNLTVSLDLYNVLDRNNTVSGAEDWRLTNQSENGPGLNCAQNDPFRTEVLAGYYGLNNFSIGVPLDIIVSNPALLGMNQCTLYIKAAENNAQPLFYAHSTNYYNFRPESDVAQWMASGPQGADQEAVMNETVLLKPALFSNSTGVFTVACGDMWGDVQVAHFVAGG